MFTISTTVLYVIIVFLVLLVLILSIFLIRSNEKQKTILLILEQLKIKQDDPIHNLERNLKEDFRISREENNILNRQNRKEINELFSEFRSGNDRQFSLFTESIRDRFSFFDKQQMRLVEQTEKRLEEIKQTVDEKLQETLNERIGQSFKIVSKQLESVQKGLGEMQNLAEDVGGLKRVLSNVKTRGTIGEFQLGMLLEQILAPGQYEANVNTNKEESTFVEYVVKLPAKDDNRKEVLLPIDAKFPKEVYEHLLDAYDSGDNDLIQSESRKLENTLKQMAKDISSKYINPPTTTDFAILFLPFESLYAEIARRSNLIEELLSKYKIVITGPTTLGAILNSLQMGFRALAIQKYSGEVWALLGAVKKEFERFGAMLQKARKNLNTAESHLDNVLGIRMKAMERTLRSVEKLSDEDTNKYFNFRENEAIDMPTSSGEDLSSYSEKEN